MMITTDSTLLSYYYRLDSVRASFCPWCKYTYDYPHTLLQDVHYLIVNHGQSDVDIRITLHLSDPHQEKLVQIPIARSSSLATSTTPAVSSLEAYQTPAR